MFIKYFYNERLAQASYMVGCEQAGAALVIDPMRDITPYLHAAKAQGVDITHVSETHIHADYVSGARELAAATRAQLLLSDEGGPNWQYRWSDTYTRLKDGDVFMVGSVKVEVWHTPGHTPEHIVFVITDTVAADRPIGVFTGDFLFVGDVGRPDLLEEAAHVAGTAEPGARQQFANIQRFKTLPDYLQIWPGHGAGSACGKSLGAVPSTTLGYEKLFNPAFQFDDEAAFVAWLLADQPEPPRYFAQMKRVNRDGPALLLELPQAQHITEAPDGIVPNDALFIDTRPNSDFAHRHIPGTINIPISAPAFSTYVGWYVDYEKPLFFIAYRNDVQQVLAELFSIGVDNVPAYFTSEVVKGAKGSLPQLSPQAVAERGLPILDVRGTSEYREEHIPNAHHIPMGYVLDYLDELPRDRPLVIQCGGGTRSQVVASLLMRAGFRQVINLEGGIEGWKAAGLPTVKGEA